MIKLGKYKHYKGKYYEVLGTARHSETQEELVYYRCLYENPHGEYWVRPLAMFTGTVTLADGSVVPRFMYIHVKLNK